MVYADTYLHEDWQFYRWSPNLLCVASIKIPSDEGVARAKWCLLVCLIVAETVKLIPMFDLADRLRG